ncbi:hypothetical protein A5658_21035 [Mycobacterium sp. 1245111.1]|nr:hypothetical protein [Mycobacterium sp. 1245111.1]OBK40628.1 hypothetical protein A5658_21035 [Mycobacterium sp. 1245111.1]
MCYDACRGGDVPELNEDPLGRSQKLERLVDGLDEKVANEHEAEGVPGNAAERENVVPTETEAEGVEPPD